MTTSVLPNDEFGTYKDNQHLEIFSIIWLDTNVDIKETRNTEQKLRSIINQLKKFQDIKQCQQYIEQKSSKDRLVLVLSEPMGQELVPAIHQLRHVISIYVYCMDKKKNEEWTCKFPKVKFIMADVDSISSSLIGENGCS